MMIKQVNEHDQLNVTSGMRSALNMLVFSLRTKMKFRNEGKIQEMLIF